jgi:large subunit ribosomal protein L4e
MKELPLLTIKGEKSSQKLPAQFREVVRPDLIRRAVHASQSQRRQRYGTDPRAGKKVAADLSKRRRKYRGSYGHGISRVHRKIMSRRGRHFGWQGALAPQTVGGMRAHPPKVERNWGRKINIKERRKAIRSAMAATLFADIVKERGHHVPEQYPFVAENAIEALSKTTEVRKVLAGWGFSTELDRSSQKKVRSGKGKRRGRKYKTKTGPLFVVSKNCPLSKSARNLGGVHVVTVKNLNTELLAPGGHAGRATIFTQSAIEQLQKENLFQ